MEGLDHSIRKFQTFSNPFSVQLFSPLEQLRSIALARCGHLDDPSQKQPKAAPGCSKWPICSHPFGPHYLLSFSSVIHLLDVLRYLIFSMIPEKSVFLRVKSAYRVLWDQVHRCREKVHFTLASKLFFRFKSAPSSFYHMTKPNYVSNLSFSLFYFVFHPPCF